MTRTAELLHAAALDLVESAVPCEDAPRDTYVRTHQLDNLSAAAHNFSGDIENTRPLVTVKAARLAQNLLRGARSVITTSSNLDMTTPEGRHSLAVAIDILRDAVRAIDAERTTNDDA